MKKIFTLAFVCVLALTCFAQDPGTFDSSFGTDGMTRFTPSTSHDYLEKILIQEDGKILTTGRSRHDGSNYDIYVSRQNTDGSMDASFGTNGIRHYQATPAIYINAARDIAFGNDGLIFIAGYTYDYENNEAFVLCIDENGFEYPYFGNEGFAISEYGGGIVYEALDVDNNGRPIVTGYLNNKVIVRRFDTAGQLDPTFGDNGTVQINFDDALYSFGYSIKVTEDNKIIVAGVRIDVQSLMLRAFVTRLEDNGTLDNTFGNYGRVDLNIGHLAEYALDIDIDPNGNYLVAGHSEIPSQSGTLARYEAYVTRILTDGTIDTSFGTDGFTRFESFSGEGCINNSEAVVAAHDGQIFGTYYSYDNITSDSRAYVYNLNENGQPNEDFAETGILPISLQQGDLEVRTAAAVMQNDGKLLIGGLFFNNDGWASDVFVTRINTNVTPNIGYNDIEAAKSNIYPNPATSTVFVETNGNAQVSIIDMTGRVIKEMETTGNVSTINIEDINEGIYFIMIQDDNNRIVEKLVVK